MAQYVVGAGHECVFLAKHAAVLAYKCQAVNIGVNHNAQVVTSLTQQVAYFAQILLQGLGVVGEVAGRLSVQASNLCHTKLAQQFGYDDTTNRVDCIDGHLEVCTADSFDVNQFEILNQLNVALVVAEVLV